MPTWLYNVLGSLMVWSSKMDDTGSDAGSALLQFLFLSTVILTILSVSSEKAGRGSHKLISLDSNETGEDCRVSYHQEAQFFLKALKFTTCVAVSPALVEMFQVSRFPLLTWWEVHIKGLHRFFCVKMLCAECWETSMLLPVAVFIFNAPDLIHSSIH